MKLQPHKKYLIGIIVMIGILSILFWSWGQEALMFVGIGFLRGTGFMLWVQRK